MPMPTVRVSSELFANSLQTRVCKPFLIAIVQLYTALTPSLYIVLPIYACIYTELERVTETTMAFGDEEETTSVQPVRALKAIKENLVIHPLHAAAIILHHSLHSIESVMPFGEKRGASMQAHRVRIE
jgi:hypothetical protein